MKKINSLKIITLLLMILLVISIATRVSAADNNWAPVVIDNTTSNGTSQIPSNNIEQANNANEVGNSLSNQVVNNSIANSITNNTVNNTMTNLAQNNTTNSNLPYAGLQSNSVIIFLLIATSISAIYTYKKVKEYNL